MPTNRKRLRGFPRESATVRCRGLPGRLTHSRRNCLRGDPRRRRQEEASGGHRWEAGRAFPAEDRAGLKPCVEATGQL